MPYSIVSILGLRYSKYRAVVFLECAEDRTVDAVLGFDRLKENRRLDLLRRFDHWIDGAQHHRKYHHGFDDPHHRDCYVFKVKDAGSHHRFYGFRAHPKPKTDPGFEVCILYSHAIKRSEDTDPSELDGAMRLKLKSEVIEAIRKVFPENGKRHHENKRPLDGWEQ